MDWSYGFDSKASNKKVADEEYEDFDGTKGKPNEDGYGYPYEDGGVMSKPRAVVVDGGQRKSSITHYPNVDGSDSYVVRTERVVKVVRPAMTTHYSLKEDRDDNLGMAKSFLDQFLKEAAMSGAPVHQSRTYWGCRDESPLKYDEYSHQFSPPNMAKFPSWEDTDEHQELGRPRTGSRRNWPSRDESPPRFITHPEWNHPNHSGGKHNWPNHDQDDYPPRSMMHPELSHINSNSARPNWPSRDNSFSGPLVRQSNPGFTPNWARQYDSPPRSVEYLEVGHSNSSAKPNWPSQYNSPPPSTRRFVSNHPNSSPRSNWQTRDDSPSRFVTHHESSYYPNSSTRPNWPSQYDDSPPKFMYLESSHPTSGVRPNWSSRDESPPRLTEYPLLSTHNASTKPNWSSRVESPPRSMTHLTLNHPSSPSTKPSWPSHQEGSPSPDNIENGRDKINTGLVLKNFDELNLQDSRGTSPLPNERSNSDVAKTANYNSMDSGQRPNWPNRKGHSTYKTNKDDHEKPKFNGAQTKNTHDEEIPDINNKKIAYKIPYSEWPVEDEDSKKSGILRSSTNVSHKASETKPNYSSGSYKQPVSSTTRNDEVSDMMKLMEEAKKTATYDPNEITPNPPQQMHYSTYAVPAAPWGYYKPVLDSNEASRKYNGIYSRT